ncbi:MAG: hypothetical protein ABIH25_04430 [Candidatus Woesearchaeota archaeon]
MNDILKIEKMTLKKLKDVGTLVSCIGIASSIGYLCGLGGKDIYRAFDYDPVYVIYEPYISGNTIKDENGNRIIRLDKIEEDPNIERDFAFVEQNGLGRYKGIYYTSNEDSIFRPGRRMPDYGPTKF